jgi:6-phosphogluconolactonase
LKRSLYVLFLMIIIVGCSNKNMPTSFFVYVGTYTGGDSEGIYTCTLDTKTGELLRQEVTSGINNPSFLAIHPNGEYLYSVGRNQSDLGSVHSFKRDRTTGHLTFLNKQSSEGAGPCHVIVDNTGKWVLTANYGGGTVSILPIKKDGSLGPATDMKKHTGSSVNPNRQNEPHPHSIWVSPDNQYVFVPDLGIDKIVIYKLDSINGKLLPNGPPFFQTAPGAGPRHFTFHPNGKNAFVINELNCTITSMNYETETGALSKKHTMSTLPKNFTAENTCADIHTTPNGRFVYGSNRGHDSIAVFSFNKETGQLFFVETESTQGIQPRNFAIDPTGSILLAANQKTNNVVTYWINQQSGELTPTGFKAKVPSPVCLKLFIKKAL